MILFYSRSSNPEYFFFSNFYDSPFILNDRKWKTVEHYYQAQKSKDFNIQEIIRNFEKPGEAARYGRTLPNLRKDWERVKVKYMYNGVYAKFDQNPELLWKLLKTGDEEIHEDSPKDEIWGWRNNGKDYLGLVIMKVRENLKRKNSNETSMLEMF